MNLKISRVICFTSKQLSFECVNLFEAFETL